MKNPLEQFVTVQERPDGVYIRVTRAERDSIDIKVVLRTLENSTVMNFNMMQFKDVFTRARGAFEKIGPSFEYYDEELDNYLNVIITPNKASLKIAETCILKGKKPSDRQLVHFLKRKGVTHGVDTDTITRMVVERRYDQFVDIAKATPPEKGADARIEFKVAISPDTKPKLRTDGSVDYRSIQTFTSVANGELLAVKYPASIGKPGITVTGDTIIPEPGKDIVLPNGRNTRLSDDGLQLFSDVTGILFYENSLLAVGELLHIPGDVDYSVGNIKYSGDVLVSGSVKPGFVVEAEGAIQIKGDIEAAKVISRTGHVIVEKGVMGKNETVIEGKSGVTLCFAQDAIIKSEGTVYINKYLLHCQVFCESLEEQEPQVSIVGGTIKAEKYVIVKQCGSENGVATKIVIFDKNKSLLSGKMKELQELREKLAAEMEPIERQLKTKANLMKRAGDEITDRQKEEVKKWVDAYNAVKKKVAFVDGKINELQIAVEKPGNNDGFIQLQGHCYPGTTLILYDVSLPVSTVQVGKKYSLKGQTIAIEG